MYCEEKIGSWFTLWMNKAKILFNIGGVHFLAVPDQWEQFNRDEEPIGLLAQGEPVFLSFGNNGDPAEEDGWWIGNGHGAGWYCLGREFPTLEKVLPWYLRALEDHLQSLENGLRMVRSYVKKGHPNPSPKDPEVVWQGNTRVVKAAILPLRSDENRWEAIERAKREMSVPPGVDMEAIIRKGAEAVVRSLDPYYEPVVSTEGVEVETRRLLRRFARKIGHMLKKG